MSDETNQIYEEGEYCDRCLGTEQLGSWNPGGKDIDLPYTICQACWADQEGMEKWFVQELEDALASNPDEWEKLPDGKWRSKKEDAK
jgi:hypothetical protein